MALSSGFDQLQRGLGGVLAANQHGGNVDHVLIALPSYSVGESLLSHYAERVPALEHRYLVAQLVLHRVERCHVIFVTCQAPDNRIVDFYASLGPASSRSRSRDQFRVLEVPDLGARSVAAKLLDRPDLLDELGLLISGRPAFIEPWNVTEAEVAIACRIGAPINGTAPELRTLGFKSEGRRLFRRAGVPVPFGIEDVCSVEEVLKAVSEMRAARPGTTAVVVKLDDSGAGDGNVVLDLRDPTWEVTVRSLPEWYMADLATGGVVEELISGTRFSSPSAQLDISPTGQVRVLATHEQVMGGSGGQVYMGCRFPSNPDYSNELASHALAVGELIAARGALGRVAVDFAAACDEKGSWGVYALEINLRKGGTTHPYTVLRNLVPGRYDPDEGGWLTEKGHWRSYSSTDNLIDPTWIGLDPMVAISAVEANGLQFDPERGTGVVLHMLSGLEIDGRIGLTAIGQDPTHAAQLHQATAQAISDAAQTNR